MVVKSPQLATLNDVGNTVASAKEKEAVGDETIVTEEGHVLGAVEHTVLEGKNNQEGWITPKGGRSPGKQSEGLQFGAVSILTNPYFVLAVEEDAEGEKQKDGDEKIVNDKNRGDTDLAQEKTETRTEVIRPNQELVGKGTCTKSELPMRPSLPRESKTAHKTVSVLSTHSTRNLPKDQSKKNSKHR